MTTLPPVHIRQPDSSRTYCGATGESMSRAFWFDHVMPNRDGCCAGIVQRLCRDCDRLAPIRNADDDA